MLYALLSFRIGKEGNIFTTTTINHDVHVMEIACIILTLRFFPFMINDEHYCDYSFSRPQKEVPMTVPLDHVQIVDQMLINLKTLLEQKLVSVSMSLRHLVFL